MDKNTTWWLTGSAVALFLFIFFFERRLPSTEERAVAPRLVAVDSNAITAVEISLPNTTNLLRAERTGGEWRLVNPPYRAQQTALENFAGVVANLKAYDRISPNDVLIQGQKSFGFDSRTPSFSIETETNRFSFQIGNSTPLTNNVYLRQKDSGEVLVTDGKLLEVFPRTQYAWRSQFFVDPDEVKFDTVQVRSGQRTFEISQNANRLWQITKPVPARADQDRIDALLQRIRMGRVKSFVSDAPADIERYGLHMPALELTLLNGTNGVFSMQFGGMVTNQTNLVYARLVGQSNVVMVDADLPEVLDQPYKNFHDSRLVSFNPAKLDRILVRGLENFTLQKQPDGNWHFEEIKTGADPALMGLFITNLAALEIIDIAKEVPTEEDLRAFGLDKPVVNYALAEKLTDSSGLPTNIMAVEISFGKNETDRIYVRRSDETPVYVTPLAQMYGLPRRAFQIREREIWSFQPSEVSGLTLINSNGTNQLTRHPELGWVTDPIANAAIEEMVFRLSKAESLQWVARGDQRLASFGCEPPAAILQVRLRRGEETAVHEVKFGKQTVRGNLYAAAILPGESEYLVFEFPLDLFQQLQPHLPPPV